jgi:threonine dehydratase
VLPPTPQYRWPLLSRRIGAEVWVKHENHTPIGAFKIRGGLVYLDDLKRAQAGIRGIVTATRGNHGQSIAYAAARLGLSATVVVPHGNSIEKNRAMAAFGARLVEFGHDFQAAYEHAIELAEHDKLHIVRTYHPMLVAGVASYGLELFRAVADIDIVYVPIGQGSGISGVMAARDALRLKTEVVGVVAENAAAYALSFAAGKPVSTNSADTIADGLAVRVPDEAALAVIRKGAARIVTVSEQ